MSIKLYAESVAGYSNEELLFSVKTFDSGCATVELKQTLHNRESWDEIAQKIGEAIGMLSLGEEKP